MYKTFLDLIFFNTLPYGFVCLKVYGFICFKIIVLQFQTHVQSSSKPLEPFTSLLDSFKRVNTQHPCIFFYGILENQCRIQLIITTAKSLKSARRTPRPRSTLSYLSFIFLLYLIFQTPTFN